jgi:hypothetical protein
MQISSSFSRVCPQFFVRQSPTPHLASASAYTYDSLDRLVKVAQATTPVNGIGINGGLNR